MNSAVVAGLFALLAVANAGLLAAPVAPVAYAAHPVAVSSSYSTGIIRGAPLVAAAPVAYHAAPLAYAAPAHKLVRVARGIVGGPVAYAAHPVAVSTSYNTGIIRSTPIIAAAPVAYHAAPLAYASPVVKTVAPAPIIYG